METHLLEINLISAQCLKPPSTNPRRLRTYAIAWIDPSFKLRTRIDQVGGVNPTWNDKFIFRAPTDFLLKDTSGVSIEIYATGYIKDHLIGTVRLLLSNCLSSTEISSSISGTGIGVPSFSALQIRRPSGRFQGVLNVGAMVINGSGLSGMTGITAIGYRDLMGDNHRKRRENPRVPVITGNLPRVNSFEIQSCEDSTESSLSDSECSSGSTTSTVLKDFNGKRKIAGNQEKSDGSGLLCGLGFQRKIHLSPSDQNLHISIPSDEKSNK